MECSGNGPSGVWMLTARPLKQGILPADLGYVLEVGADTGWRICVEISKNPGPLEGTMMRTEGGSMRSSDEPRLGEFCMDAVAGIAEEKSTRSKANEFEPFV